MLQSNHKDTPNTLSRHHKPKDLTIQLKNSFIFINIFKTYFLIYSVSDVTELYQTMPIGVRMNNTLIHPVIASIISTLVLLDGI